MHRRCGHAHVYAHAAGLIIALRSNWPPPRVRVRAHRSFASRPSEAVASAPRRAPVRGRARLA
eukprot:6211208-Pleurochrysis_carterae.AAC.2